MSGNFLKNRFKKLNNTLFKFVNQPGLGKTLFFWFLALSLVPFVASSVISYLTASRILQQDAVQSLNSVSKLKAEYINSFFNERINQLEFISQLNSSIQGLRKIIRDHKSSGESLEEYVRSVSYDVGTVDISIDLDNFQRTYNYKDIYVLDLHGNIMFTLDDEDIRGTNVFTGELSRTVFADTCKKALQTKKPLFSDLEYLPGKDEPSSFLIQKMRENRTIPVGIMAVRIPMEKINQIMQEDMEISQIGETYLVGEDLLMRSGLASKVLKTQVKTEVTSRWLDKIKNLKKKNNKVNKEIGSTNNHANTQPGNNTNSNTNGNTIGNANPEANDSEDTSFHTEKPFNYVNYRGEEVLGISYELESLEKLGVQWGLIAEITESVAFASADNLRLISIFIAIITVLVVSLLSILVARQIVKPIRRLSSWAQRVAIGDLEYEEITSEENEIGEMNASFKAVVDSFRAVTDVCEKIALGDVTRTVPLRSEKDALGKAVNQMKDNLVEVVRQADEISMGDYSGNVVPRSDKDVLGYALERMIRTLRDAALVAEEVSVGDYSQKMEIKGEKDMLGNALNQMIERLRESNADSQRKIDYLNNIPTPVHVIDVDFTVQFINKAGAEIAGKTVEQSIGKKCYSLFNTSHCRTEKCRAYRAMNRNKVLTGDTVASLPDKKVPMRYTSAPLKDHEGNIIGAIEYMVDISDEMQVVQLAERISEGDYSVEVKKRSDEDRLSKALNRMTSSLREAVELNERQNWLKTGQTELNNRMRGELDIPELAGNIIGFLTKYLDAQVGLLYFATKDETLKLVGSYALGKEKAGVKRFKFGEGIVGQAASEKTLIAIDDIPIDFVKIRTGFGEIAPQHAIAVPYFYEGNVIGVIELASIHEIQDIQKEFLMQSLENIGIALNSAESRRQLEELLQKTQEQAEKLQAQQEELRQSNEELEGQTKALIASETNLQSQQEELRVINEELEERTRALEKQKSDIQDKNKELLVARNEIAKKARDLEEVSKYKSEFLANMSHELRTPLNSILILSQLLSNNTESNLSDKQVEFSKTIHSSGSDLLALINEILDLSKIEAGMMEIRVEKIHIQDFAGNIKRVFKPVANNKGLEFKMDIRQENMPDYFYTDSQRAQQVVKNLLSNAFKFTDEGSVTFGIYRPSKEIDLSQSGLKPDSALAFEVRDTGIGIPSEKQNIIFEAFRQEDGTTSRKYGGTGLGLSISRELALLLGGEIKMSSEKGKGSIFTLFLPEKLSAPAKKESTLQSMEALIAKSTETGTDGNEEAKTTADNKVDAEVVAAAANLLAQTAEGEEQEVKDDRRQIKPGDKSLLIVEDDFSFSEVLVELARARGFRCIVAEDGETGLHFADFYKPSAIILDVGLPGINGWEVMDRLKENPDTRHIPVHFMSAADNTRDALQKGAIGYLTKPVSTEAIDVAFGKIEDLLSKPVKRLLIVDGNSKERKNIKDLMGSGDIATLSVKTGEEALQLLGKEDFDAIILNPNLNDMPGFELLDEIKKHPDISQLPIIIYSENKLTKKEEEQLRMYEQSITVKDVRSLDRLFAEATLFLHRVEADMPVSKQKILKRMVDKKDTLHDKKILVVDDDMRNVFALTSILEDSGLKTVVGKNGQEGVNKLEEDPDIDLVLMDIMMPVMDGYEAMRKIRKDKRFEKLPIIALTAKAMKGDRSKCVAAGASDYLAKPVDSAKLLSLLRVWLYQSK